MSIFTEGTFNDPITQDDLEPTAGARRRATVADAWASMVGPSLYRWGELDEARKWGGMAFGEMSPDQARSWIDEQGLGGHLTVEDRQYNPLELSILARRKKAELQRQYVLERTGGGLAEGAERLTLSLATSLADPLTVATAFVPVVNEATYGRLLAQAGRSALARAGVRAGVGAAEGTVGQALVEPIVYGAHQAEQADYTLYDSLANIAFGGVFGGGLHAVGGAVVDWRTGRRVARLTAARETLRSALAGIDQQAPPGARPAWESPFKTTWVDESGRTVVSATRANTPADNVLMPHSQVDLTEFPDNTLRVTWAGNGRKGPDLPKGEGHVTALYKEGIKLAEATGRKFTSDSSVTLGAVRVWERLKRDGYDVWRNPAAELKRPPDVVTDRWVTPDNSPVFEVRSQAKQTASPSEKSVTTSAHIRAPHFDDWNVGDGNPDFFLHITDEANAESIASQGIRPNGSQDAPADGFVYLWNSHLDAEAAQIMTEARQTRGMSYDAAQSAPEAYFAVRRDAIEGRIETDPHTGEVRVQGTIPPDALVRLDPTAPKVAAIRAENAAPQTRENALRAVVAQDLAGEPVNVEPLFDLDPATRTRPISETLDQLRRPAAEPQPEPVPIVDATERTAVEQQIADLDEMLKDLEAELKLDEADLPADLRADLEAVKEAEAEARDLAETARMLAACAMRKSA